MILKTLIWNDKAVISLAIIGFFWATSQGLGVTPDSISYLDGAFHLSQYLNYAAMEFQNCEIVPTTHHPPLLSAMIALLQVLGLDSLASARLLNAILFGLSAYCANAIVEHATNTSRSMRALTSLMVMSSVVMLNIHTMVWSEPLYIFLILSGFLALRRYLIENQTSQLVLASLIISLVVFSRYMGFTLIPVGVACLWVLTSHSFSRKLRDITLFSIIAALPMALFILRNILVADNAANRNFGWDFVKWGELKFFLTTLGSWLVPGSDRFIFFQSQGLILGSVAFFLGCALCLSVLFIIRKDRKASLENSINAKNKTLGMLTLFLPVHSLTLIFSTCLIQAHFTFNDRILSSLYIVGLLVIIIFLARKLSKYQEKFPLFKSLLKLWICGQVMAGVVWLVYCHHNGRGYTSKDWQRLNLENKILKEYRELPKFSNIAPAVYFLTEFPTYWLPPVEATEEFPTQELFDQMKSEKCLLIFFDLPQKYSPRTQIKYNRVGINFFKEEFDLTPVSVEDKVSIYVVNEGS